MARSTTNLGLTVWDSNADTFDHTALASNWDKIDADYTRTRPTNSAEVRTTVPTTGNFEGRLIYLSAADSGYVAGTLLKYHGSGFTPVNGIEVLGTLPTQNVFAGRIVLLSASSGGFSAWSLVRYDGTSWAVVNNTYEILSSVPVSNNFAGRLVMLSAASGGFNAWDLISFNGSTWVRIGPSPIPPGTEPAYLTVSVDTTTTNLIDPGDTLLTFSAGTFEATKYYLHITIPALSNAASSAAINFRLRESSTNIGNAVVTDTSATAGQRNSFTALIPFTPTAGSHTYNVSWWTSTGTAKINTTGLSPAIFRIFKA